MLVLDFAAAVARRPAFEPATATLHALFQAIRLVVLLDGRSTPGNRRSTAGPSGPGDAIAARRSIAVADTVVQKFAGLATHEVPGVFALGGGATRAFSALREQIPGASASAG